MQNILLTQQITRILAERINIEVESDHLDLVEAGLLDSLGLVELMASLEETFAIRISFDEIEIDNFRSVTSIAAFVMARRPAESMAA